MKVKEKILMQENIFNRLPLERQSEPDIKHLISHINVLHRPLHEGGEDTHSLYRWCAFSSWSRPTSLWLTSHSL